MRIALRRREDITIYPLHFSKQYRTWKATTSLMPFIATWTVLLITATCRLTPIGKNICPINGNIFPIPVTAQWSGHGYSDSALTGTGTTGMPLPATIQENHQQNLNSPRSGGRSIMSEKFNMPSQILNSEALICVFYTASLFLLPCPPAF